MKNQTTQKIAAFVLPTVLLFSVALPVFAQNTVAPVKAGNTSSVKLSKTQAKSDTAIQKRITDLTALETTINEMANVSADTKTKLSTSLSSAISDLSVLKAKVDADTTTKAVGADAKLMTTSTRVYMLLVPQARILAAADRANTVATMITNLDTKLQTRVATAQTAGEDMSAATVAQADLTSKLADANTQAQSAISSVSNLTPDNGDKTLMASNDVALKTARMAITAINKDLQVARADIKKITDTLKVASNTKVNTATPTTTPVTQ